MRTFLCSIDESVWDAVEIGWTRPEAAKSTWDKAARAASNANSITRFTIYIKGKKIPMISLVLVPPKEY